MSLENTFNTSRTENIEKKNTEFSVEFFQLELQFAAIAAQLLTISIKDAISRYTNIYNLISEGKPDYESAKKVWDEFDRQLKEYSNPDDIQIVAQTAHTMCKKTKDPHPVNGYYGCFSYEIHEDKGSHGEILIHFTNRNDSNTSPLSTECIQNRKKELSEMFKDIRSKYPNAKYEVTGASWLYNIPQYKNLFPADYQASLVLPENIASSKRFLQNMGIWGQFVKADGSVHTERRDLFLQRAKSAKTEAELLEAFPLKVLMPRASIQSFYDVIEQ